MNDLNNPVYKLYNVFVQGSILVFTLSLVYFAFVYYPRVLGQYRVTTSGIQQQLVAPVAADTGRLPIETENYRISFEADTSTYYAFIEGRTIDDYFLNRNGSQLALKSALSLESLCNLDVVYVSTEDLVIPKQYKSNNNCG